MIRLTLTALVLLAACSQKPSAPPTTGGMGVSVTAPVSNSKVTSPLKVEGTAPASWFASKGLAVELAVDGEVITHVDAQGDWTKGEPVPFSGVLTFMVNNETKALLTIANDPASAEIHRLRIPVVLEPPK